MTSPDPVPAPAFPLAVIVTTEGSTLSATEVTAQAAAELAATLPALETATAESGDAIAAPMKPAPTPTTAKAGIRIQGHRRLVLLVELACTVTPDLLARRGGAAGHAVGRRAVARPLAGHVDRPGARRAKGVPEDDGAGHLEDPHDDEPDAHEGGERGHRADRGRDDDDARGQADDAEHHRPPATRAASAGAEAHEQRNHALHDPGQADDQADQREAEVQVTDQHRAAHDEQDPGYPPPHAPLLGPADRVDDVEDPREDHQDAQQHGDHVERPGRVERH